MTTLLLTHPCFVDHDTGPGHPERPDRMRAIDKVLGHEVFNGLKREQAPLREDVEEPSRSRIRAATSTGSRAQRPREGEEPVRLDPDTVLSPKSWEPALRAVGAGLAAVDAVMDPAKSGVKNAFAQVRPCGHHAEAERAMGFCIFSNVAIAGLYARKKYGAERVAVVDFDVHHGNGTQDIFWSDKNLYFASTHQMPLYPGTGALSETGVGNIWNAPLRPGDGGDPFKEAFESRILPTLAQLRPGHRADLGRLRRAPGRSAGQSAPDGARFCLGDGARSPRLPTSMHRGGWSRCSKEATTSLRLAKSVGVHVKALMDAGA